MVVEDDRYLEVGRLLRANNSAFVVGCQSPRMERLAFGSLVNAPQPGDYRIFGLITSIQILDDGLTRQLITAQQIQENVIADNRLNRNVPLEISVITTGYQLDGQINHLIPPRPPMSLDRIYQCDPVEMVAFTSTGRFGYFRHVLRGEDYDVGELLAAHIRQATASHQAAGNPGWQALAIQELIIQLRDDYPTLMHVLGAIRDATTV